MIYMTSRQNAMRFAIQYLSSLAKQSGIIDYQNIGKKYNRYFHHILKQQNKPDEELDLTPANSYAEPDPELRTNFTFITSQDDDFLLLRKLYRQLGVKSNNHLVEEIIYSMAACIMAFSAGYSIYMLDTCITLEGFGNVCLDYNQNLNAALSSDSIRESATVTALSKYQNNKNMAE